MYIYFCLQYANYICSATFGILHKAAHTTRFRLSHVHDVAKDDLREPYMRYVPRMSDCLHSKPLCLVSEIPLIFQP
jgi:hypothetical protein